MTDWVPPTTCQELLYHNPARSLTQVETEVRRVNLLLEIKGLVSGRTRLHTSLLLF